MPSCEKVRTPRGTDEDEDEGEESCDGEKSEDGGGGGDEAGGDDDFMSLRKEAEGRSGLRLPAPHSKYKRPEEAYLSNKKKKR